jgi:hypothetical protein
LDLKYWYKFALFPYKKAINPTGQGILTVLNQEALKKDGKGCEEEGIAKIAKWDSISLR